MSSSTKKERKINSLSNIKRNEDMQVINGNMINDSKNEDEEEEEEEISTPSVQQMYFDAVKKGKNLKGHRQSLFIVIILLLIVIYSSRSEQNNSQDRKQVNLNIVLSDDFPSYIQNNPEEFQFNFTNIFIEYQKAQYENTQSSSMRYYMSVFDKWVFGSVQDGQIINKEEEIILNKCIEDHKELKENIKDNIESLKRILEKNKEEEREIIIEEIEEMELFLRYRNVTLNYYMNSLQNKGQQSIYYDYYQYTIDKVQSIKKQMNILDTDMISNELDIIIKNMVLIESRSKEQKNLLKTAMKTLIQKNISKSTKNAHDLLFEEYLQQDYQYKIEVFQKRLHLQHKITLLKHSREHYLQLYQEGVKQAISHLVDSFFQCIRLN